MTTEEQKKEFREKYHKYYKGKYDTIRISRALYLLLQERKDKKYGSYENMFKSYLAFEEKGKPLDSTLKDHYTKEIKRIVEDNKTLRASLCIYKKNLAERKETIRVLKQTVKDYQRELNKKVKK